MSYICRVRKPDGSFNDELPFVKLERTNKLNEMETARVWVPAPDAQNQTIVEDQDEIEVLDEGTFTRWDGVITEIREHADRYELVSDGFERYARYAEPTAGTQDYSSATDDTIVFDAISNVPQLSAGTINQVNSDTFDVTFYFASQALKIRRMREAANVAYVNYNFNKTVDYKASLGSDKTGNANLSPNNRNITDFRVNRSDPQPTPTHIRVIGNNGNYEDVVSSSYSQGDNQIWLRAYYNDLSSSTLLTSTGEQLLAELEQDTERIELTIPGPADRSQGITPNLGDTYHIKYPDYDVDRGATIAEVTEIIDKEGTHYECVFSDRDVTFDRDEEHEVRSSLKRRFDETGLPGRTQFTAIPMTELEDGEWISTRLHVAAGDTFHLLEIGVQNESNNAPSGLTAEVDDETNTTNLASVNSTQSTGSPVASVSGEVDIALRTENDTGDTQTATSYFKISVG